MAKATTASHPHLTPQQMLTLIINIYIYTPFYLQHCVLSVYCWVESKCRRCVRACVRARACSCARVCACVCVCALVCVHVCGGGWVAWCVGVCGTASEVCMSFTCVT